MKLKFLKHGFLYFLVSYLNQPCIFRTQLFFIKLCQILATENFEIILILAHQNFNIAIKWLDHWPNKSAMGRSHWLPIVETWLPLHCCNNMHAFVVRVLALTTIIKVSNAFSHCKMGKQLIRDKQTLEKKQRELLTLISKRSTHHHTQCIFFSPCINWRVDPCCSRGPGGPENGMHELVMTSVDGFQKQWELDPDLWLGSEVL